MPYDSTEDTLLHKHRVEALLAAFASELRSRGRAHDLSKLGPLEKPALDANPPDFDYRYGDPQVISEAMRLARSHHLSVNSHHPEHYGDAGISGMDLGDLVEMFFDWKAAGEPYRHASFKSSLEINRERYRLDPQIVAVFTNTARRLGWIV